MIDNIKALNRLETTKDYLKELYREQVENCPYPELKAIAKQTYEDNQMAFNIAIKAIKESNRQQAEIERLKNEKMAKEAEYNDMLEQRNSVEGYLETAKAEAVKEFAERLKNKKARYNADYFYVIDYIPSKEIDNLVKEMVGEG